MIRGQGGVSELAVGAIVGPYMGLHFAQRAVAGYLGRFSSGPAETTIARQRLVEVGAALGLHSVAEIDAVDGQWVAKSVLLVEGETEADLELQVRVGSDVEERQSAPM